MLKIAGIKIQKLQNKRFKWDSEGLLTLQHVCLSLSHRNIIPCTFNLAVSAAVVPSTTLNMERLAPLLLLLPPSSLRKTSTTFARGNLLAAFSPFWKYFSTAPSKPWGPFFEHTHTHTHSAFQFSHHLSEKAFNLFFFFKEIAQQTGSEVGISEMS